MADENDICQIGDFPQHQPPCQARGTSTQGGRVSARVGRGADGAEAASEEFIALSK